MDTSTWMLAKVLKRMKPRRCAEEIARLFTALSGPTKVANDHLGLTVEKRAEGLAWLANTCATCPKECSLAGRSLKAAERMRG